MCDEHHGRTVVPNPGGTVRGTDVPWFIKPGSDIDIFPNGGALMTECKIEGCTQPSAGKGGSWMGLCMQHVREEGQRRQAAGQARRVLATVADEPVDDTSPLPEVEENGNGHASLTFTELAQAVDHARAAYDEALSKLATAVSEAVSA
jgi:hypothetical protein